MRTDVGEPLVGFVVAAHDRGEPTEVVRDRAQPRWRRCRSTGPTTGSSCSYIGAQNAGSPSSIAASA